MLSFGVVGWFVHRSSCANKFLVDARFCTAKICNFCSQVGEPFAQSSAEINNEKME